MPSIKFALKCRSVIKIYNENQNIFLNINTDSRTFKKGEAFVCLTGENFDGFTYVDQVLNIGATSIVYAQKEGRNEVVLSLATKYPETVFIETIDSLQFIQELATVYLADWKSKRPENKIIGITGSNGKTTHKEMLSFLISEVFPNKVLATKGNFNNHIGVPLTIFRINQDHEVAIIEMGMNHQGEISELCNIAKPEHGIITNIGPAHIEFMKTLENIFIEKATLYKEVVKNSKGHGVFVVNADDENLRRLEKSSGLLTYGETFGDLKVKIKDGEISFNINNKEVLITNKNIEEHHNLKNLAGVLIFAMRLFPDKKEELCLAASKYTQPSMNRSQWIDNIYLDAYNANPSSMIVSLNSFVEIISKKNVSLSDCYFVLGDMNELGEMAPILHKEIAEKVSLLNIKNITFIGRYKDYYLTGFSKPTSSYLSKEEFYNEWKFVRQKYKYIFIKASRSLQLETLLSIV